MLISAEIRWFWPNVCPPELNAWFHRDFSFPPGGGRARTDRYVLGRGDNELGVKQRGEPGAERRDRHSGIEVKGLVGVLPSLTWSELCPRVELWCKWQSKMALPSGRTVDLQKTRHLRKLDTSSPQAVEIRLNDEEKPKEGGFPQEGCNIELTCIQSESQSDSWWTLGFEAFGSLQTAPRNLDRAIAHAVSHALPPLKGAIKSYPAWLAERYPPP
jgi:hypothetical protein